MTTSNNKLVDLNTVVNNLPEGVELVQATAVNASGQITAVGSNGRNYLICPR